LHTSHDSKLFPYTTLFRSKVSDVLRNIKANSSKWLHRDVAGHKDFRWQAGYGAFTVSASQKDIVYQYIANQSEHHKEMSFKEELDRKSTRLNSSHVKISYA